MERFSKNAFHVDPELSFPWQFCKPGPRSNFPKCSWGTSDQLSPSRGEAQNPGPRTRLLHPLRAQGPAGWKGLESRGPSQSGRGTDAPGRAVRG